MRLARQQGYRPHPAARELITGQSQIVGAVVPTVNNIFFMDLFHELGSRLAERKLRLQVSPVRDPADFLAVLEDFAARRVRLGLVVPPEDYIQIPGAITGCLPLISLISPCRGKGIHFISADEEKTGREAVRHLYNRGHRHILHLTYERRAYAIMARARGYKRQTRELGLNARITTTLHQKQLISLLKKERITAIFCHNDWLALTVLLSLSKSGIRVPEDVSVLGVDNSPTLMALHPGLTTMAYPVGAVGRAIADILDGGNGQAQEMEYQIMERATVRNL
ncbi:MAG: LacI family transcriptional regulator [Methylacidiphilales bacterium]|nr:LacI family transcriptional regulator [Candidatus Methylacidiphilales bacterium]